MNIILHYSLLLLIPSLVLLHLIVSPYTKVEESFNIQAVHDILANGIPTQNVRSRLEAGYDHFEFPGSVPRSFVGALVLSTASWPITKFDVDGLNLQVFVRAILGLFNAYCINKYRYTVAVAYGKTAGYWFILLQASQFHLIYYASRTLPNSFALGLSNLALSSLVLSNFGPRPKRATRSRLGLGLLTIAGVVFRSELALLLAFQAASLLIPRRNPQEIFLHTVLPAGMAGLFIGLTLTVSTDSFFWQQFPLWPEWAAFRYNTIDGHASEWGTSPLPFYFANALPRLLLNPFAYLVCIPLSLSEKYTRTFSLHILAPLLAYVAAYSLLPHKEWRFIVYVVPPLTGVAASGASWIWQKRRTTLVYRALALTLVASTLASFAASTALLYVSSLNYPGAVALQRLHAYVEAHEPHTVNITMRSSPSEVHVYETTHQPRLIRVHLTNLALQTGVTRFLQKKPTTDVTWFYDKTEDAQTLLDPRFWAKFDYVVVEGLGERAIGHWESVDVVLGFAGLGIDRGGNVENVGERDFETVLDEQVTKGTELDGGWSAAAWRYYGVFEHAARKYITRGYWVKIKMEPKLSILVKKDEYVL